MPSITYPDKSKFDPEGTPDRQWRDVDANEVKLVVNAKQDNSTNLTAIAVISTNGYLKRTGPGSWAVDAGPWPSLAGFIDFAGNRLGNLTDPVGAQDADTKAARDAAIATALAAIDAFVFKGGIDASTEPDYPAADAGWTYKFTADGKIGGAAGIAVKSGDSIICTEDGTPSGDQATVGDKWIIIRANLDGVVIGPNVAVDERIAVFDQTTGKLIKDGGMTINEVLAYADAAGGFAQQYAEGLFSNVPVKITMDVVRTTPLPSYTVVPYPTSSRTQLLATVNGYFPTTDDIVTDATHQPSYVLVAGEVGANAKWNGTYIVLDKGSPTTKWLLMRTLDTQNVYANFPMEMASVTIRRGTVYAKHEFRQENIDVNVDVSDQLWIDITPLQSATLQDVLTFGADAAGLSITELGGITNITNDFNLSAPNILLDGTGSVAISSSAGGAYLAGFVETIVGSGLEPVSIVLPFVVNEGDIFFQGAGNRVDALPLGSGKQVVGISAGSLAFKQLVYSDLNMTAGSLLGRSTVGTGAIELINPGDGIDMAAGNLAIGGVVAGNISFSASSAALKLMAFTDWFDFNIDGANSKVRIGFGGTAVSLVQILTQGFSLGVGRNNVIGNPSTLSIGTNSTFTLAGGDATNNDGSSFTITGGPAHGAAGNGKGGGVTLKTNIGHGTGLGGDIIFDIATGGLLKFATIGVTAAVSVVTTHKLKIDVGGTPYYICLTATA